MARKTKLEQKEHHRAEAGNTDIQPPQYLYWSFTFNNYVLEQIEQIERIFQHECDWYIFQEEIGEETKTPHLQGTLKLKNRQRLTQIKHWCIQIHWQPTKCVKASMAYCLKQKTRAGRQWVYGIEIPEEIKVAEPRGWQLEVMDIITQEPDDRTIHWFWEPDGNVGKTTLCKYLVVKHNALVLTGKANDMYHMIAKFPNKRKLILVDVPRTSLDYVNYAAIENIKNGLICSGKYEGAQLVFNCPHVIVFANEPPDVDKMSKDRWHIVCISK